MIIVGFLPVLRIEIICDNAIEVDLFPYDPSEEGDESVDCDSVVSLVQKHLSIIIMVMTIMRRR